MLKKLVSLYLSVFLITAGFLPQPLSWAQESKKTTLAVLDLTANDISVSEAASMSDYLRGQITRIISSGEYIGKMHISYTILERAQMDKIFDEFNVQNTGCTDITCAVEFGKMLNAERIVIGSVGLVGETYTISTRIVDVETSSTLAVADYLFTGQRDNLLRVGIPAVANELLYGQKLKKSKKLYYIIGGVIIAGGILGALLGSSSSDSGKGGSTGTITVDIPDPSE